jgi:hypothetical protein
MWHDKIKFPSWVIYGFNVNVMENLEKTMTIIPVNVIISEVTPKGIESSMLCLSYTFYDLNLILRALGGWCINSIFVHCDDKNIEDNLWKLYIF